MQKNVFANMHLPPHKNLTPGILPVENLNSSLDLIIHTGLNLHVMQYMYLTFQAGSMVS